eukprot:scaffold15467_cov109-Isochrysis_galbana.AAC.1
MQRAATTRIRVHEALELGGPAIPELCPRPRSARHGCTRPGFGCVGEGVRVGEAARDIHERSNGSRVSQPGMHPGVIASFRNGMLPATPPVCYRAAARRRSAPCGSRGTSRGGPSLCTSVTVIGLLLAAPI